jgi:hypothetical protein
VIRGQDKMELLFEVPRSAPPPYTLVVREARVGDLEKMLGARPPPSKPVKVG